MKSPALPEATPAWRRSPALLVALTLAFFGFLLVPKVRANAHLTQSFVAVGVMLLVWEALLWARSRGKGHGFRIETPPLVKSHWVQGLVQGSVYVYWGWYWREVYAEAPLIAAQFVFLLILDALVSWTRGRAFRLGLGPVPIVFSTNLFLWFKDDWFAWQFVLMALAALGKEFIRWKRDGRSVHIFNPSAFALSVVSIVLIATHNTEMTWGVEIATTLHRPPHIYLQIFLVGLIVQFFFGVTLMTLAAAATLVVMNVIYTAATGSYYFIDTNIAIAVFLGMHLLVTDPKTSPRSNSGKVLFGALYAVTIWALYAVLAGMGAPQFYDKLLPVPILNLCVRWIDRLTDRGLLGRLTKWEAAFSRQRLNVVHMGCWVALFLSLLGTGFVQARHEGATIEFWKNKAYSGVPGADQRLLQVVHTQIAKGSGSACNALGALYVDGRVVPRDTEQAAHWFSEACARGVERGCLNLQRLRDPAGAAAAADAAAGAAGATATGPPVPAPIDPHLLVEGARRGDVESAKALAELRVVARQSQHLDVAVPVLEGAAAAGDAQACLLLAHVAFHGLHGPADATRAQQWLEKACDLGSKEACEALKGG